MPYRVKKSGGGYRVHSPGRTYSKKPMSKKKAQKQLAAIKMHTNEAAEEFPGLPPGYELSKLGHAWRLVTPRGNEQSFMELDKAIKYAQWHHSLSSGEWGQTEETGEMNQDEANMVQVHSIKEMFGLESDPSSKAEAEVHEDKTPAMSEVFVVEAPVQNRPPPGSQPVRPTDWNQMGQRGQALKQGLTALQGAGQEMTPYKTPAGDTMAFPKDAAPGRGPVKADVTKGTWAPMTGSQGGGTGTPFSSQAPSTTMK